MEILRCERGREAGYTPWGEMSFWSGTFGARPPLRCADLPWRARHVVFLLEILRTMEAWSRLAFPGGPGLGTCAPPGAPCFRPRPQTCHVTKIRLKPRRSPTNIALHPPVFPWRWWWMSVNFLSSSSLPTQPAALLTASCFASQWDAFYFGRAFT